MKLFAKLMFGPEQSFEMRDNANVTTLIHKVSTVLLLPINGFKIVVGGRPITDAEPDKLLVDMGITNETKLMIAIVDKKNDNPIEAVIRNARGEGSKGSLAVLRFQKCLHDFVHNCSLMDLENYAMGMNAGAGEAEA